MDDVRWHDESCTGSLDTDLGSAGARYRAKLAQYPERRAQSNVMRLAREIVRALWRPRARRWLRQLRGEAPLRH